MLQSLLKLLSHFLVSLHCPSMRTKTANSTKTATEVLVRAINLAGVPSYVNTKKTAERKTSEVSGTKMATDGEIDIMFATYRNLSQNHRKRFYDFVVRPSCPACPSGTPQAIDAFHRRYTTIKQ